MFDATRSEQDASHDHPPRLHAGRPCARPGGLLKTREARPFRRLGRDCSKVEQCSSGQSRVGGRACGSARSAGKAVGSRSWLLREPQPAEKDETAAAHWRGCGGGLEQAGSRVGAARTETNLPAAETGVPNPPGRLIRRAVNRRCSIVLSRPRGFARGVARLRSAHRARTVWRCGPPCRQHRTSPSLPRACGP